MHFRDRTLVDRDRKGRLLHDAYGNAESVLAAGVREAEARDAVQFDNDLGFLAHGICAERVAAALTKEKIGYSRKVPYFLARLGEACVDVGSRERPSPCDLRVLERRPIDPRIAGRLFRTLCAAASRSGQSSRHPHQWVCRKVRPRQGSPSVSSNKSSWLAVDCLDNAPGPETRRRTCVAIQDGLRWAAAVEQLEFCDADLGRKEGSSSARA